MNAKKIKIRLKNWHFSKNTYANTQQLHEEKPSFTNHERKANQNHSEICWKTLSSEQPCCHLHEISYAHSQQFITDGHGGFFREGSSGEHPWFLP